MGIPQAYPEPNRSERKSYAKIFTGGKKYVVFLLIIFIVPSIFAVGIKITDSVHLYENKTFISNVFSKVSGLDNLWTEPIFKNQIIRVFYERNLTNGSVIDVYTRNPNLTNTWFGIYHINTTAPLLGTSKIFNSPGEEDFIELGNLFYQTDIFDFKILGGENGYLEFDYIHDATRFLTDINLTSSSYFIVEGEEINLSGFYATSATGGPTGDVKLGLNDTNNNLALDNVCDTGDTFRVGSIIQNLCVGCTDNNDGTIILLDPNNGEEYNLIWNLIACSGSSGLSPANFQTYEITSTSAVLDNSTGDITISGAPSLEILYPLNGSTYNSKNLFIRTNITGNSLDTCWYNLNDVGNITFSCGVEPNITAVEGINNLSAYANNTVGLEASDSSAFIVNSSIPLTISITSPANGSIRTEGSPQIKLLAFDINYSSINYTLYIYHANDTLYSEGNNGILTNNTETEITLSPALVLFGNITTYKILVNATDGINNATSNVLFYTLTKPTINLVSPTNNYWDADGDISFSFSVYDEAFTNISCSLQIDDVVNQTNFSSLTGGTVTAFNVLGISEGINKVWKVNCTDAENNSGQASRIFNVDKTNPMINWIKDSPDPVDAGEILNITANITDNFGVDEVMVNISGAPYYMDSTGENIYYYEYNTSGLSGDYNYSINASDNVDNFVLNDSGSFNVVDCSYSGSGNWVVNCSDNCSITSNVDVLGNNISIIGTGSFSTTANITNFTGLYLAGDSFVNRCEVYCSNGGCFK